MYNYIVLSLIVSLLLILLLSSSNKSNFCNMNIEIFKYNTHKTPKIVIISGVHGNEWAPPIGVQQFMDNNDFSNIDANIVIIPRANVEGLIENTRYVPCLSSIFYKHDINRNFFTPQEKKLTENSIEKQIINEVIDADFVLDFHEGFSYNRINKDSIGSTISISNNDLSLSLAEIMVEDINKHITEDFKKFNVLYIDQYNIPHTLRDFCEKMNINYNLVEITGQNNIQPKNVRVDQTLIILNSLFDNIKII